MDLFLKAIESHSQEESPRMPLPNKEEEKNETVLSFDERPPQWCIVDKWFTVRVYCHDQRYKKLEIFLYNMEGLPVHNALCCDDGTHEGRRAISTVDKNNIANFRLKFVSGSKGAWLFLGIHPQGQPEKCLLKSPPIKVQTNRSKRPRDSKKRPIPSVTSLSPNIVPSIGNFPGQKDRMLLIFGANFFLWGNSPIVRIEFESKQITEIRPPQIIWWNDHLLECQLPVCSSDIIIQVANYDLVFGEGKKLKVDIVEPDEALLLKLDRPLGGLRIPEYDTLKNEKLSISYTRDSNIFEIKLCIHIKKYDYLLIETSKEESQKIPLENVGEEIGAVIRIWNKSKDDMIEEINLYSRGIKFNQDIGEETLSLTANPKKEKITSYHNDPLIITAKLRKESTKEYLIDPETKKHIKAERQIPASGGNEKTQSLEHQSSSVIYDKMDSAKLEIGTFAGSSYEDPFKVKQNLAFAIAKATTLSELSTWERVFHDSLDLVQDQRQRFYAQKTKKETNTEKRKISNLDTELAPQESSTLENMESNANDESFRTISIAQKDDVSFPSNFPGKQGVIYWKFFNPGNRTFLELSGGKLQIIGSRRIQMLIESIPNNSKFLSAHLYVQRNDRHEMIEFCARCKENGIPNVFCVLPRRGRENDYPWITFRITCTSTGKHWRGSPFWIGAEFLVDPTTGTVAKVFSPPIHVQSKVKNKDGTLEEENSID